jgi:hypothetical protein
MSYSYSNPYAQAQSSRTPITTAATSQHCQILFGGLPTDASEQDLKVRSSCLLPRLHYRLTNVQDLLTSPMLSLSEHSVFVKGLYSAEGKSLGMALVQLMNGADAEKVRSHCSGQILDASESHIDTRCAELMISLPPIRPTRSTTYTTTPSPNGSAFRSPRQGHTHSAKTTTATS